MSEFTLSTEQEAFILSALQGNNILVDACIGSGKTTAIQHLCNRLPDSKSILYLTYNRLLKIDAQKKIIRQNIVVTNYHGYAYEILKQLGIKSSPQELIQNFLKIKPTIASFDLLIIDEYQDIISELADMLEYIKSANPSMQIVAVGDMSQKIYDFSSLNVTSFISDFLGNHVTMNFTQCFRLS